MTLKYKSICKNDYSESNNGISETFLFKGITYEVHEEYWGNDIMRKVITTPYKDGITNNSVSSYVRFLTIPFFDYFYTTEELRDIKLKEIGI